MLSQSVSLSLWLSVILIEIFNYRPTSASAKGLTSAVEQQNIAKSKNTSTARKSSSPTATSGGGSASSVICDDDEIYGFTSANFGLLYNYMPFSYKY